MRLTHPSCARLYPRFVCLLTRAASRSKPASEVYVTGTFDDWKKTIKLDKENGVFSRQVDLPLTDKNILYKFVVDGDWTIDSSAALETDASNNVNNLLKPADISPIPAGGRSLHGSHPAPVAATAIAAGIMPGASTLEKAGQVPLQKTAADSDAMPGTFPPETPGEQLPGDQTSVSVPPPTPPVMFTPGDITDFSTYTSDVSAPGDAAAKSGEQTFSVNPIPASAGIGNPISLKPGEPVPPSALPVDHAVRTDQAAYEKSDAYPSASGKALDTQSGAFGVPPVSGTMIPESSLPMGDSGATGAVRSGPFIQSAGEGTSTAALAGAVPKEPHREATVVKDESESTSPSAVAVAGGAVAGVAAGAAALAAGVPSSIQQAISSISGGTAASAAEPKEPASDVPEPVKSAQAEANASPEASGNPEAVTEKSQVERELLNTVPATEEAGEPAPAVSAVQSAVAPGAQGTSTPAAFSKDPTIADDSTAAAIAAVNTGAVSQAPAFQGDPIAAGQSANATATPSAASAALNASAEQPAKSTATEASAAKDTSKPTATLPGSATNAADSARGDSRDVSPMSKPTVTSGIESTATPTKQTGAKGESSASGSPATDSATDKKNKRRSFFGRIKDKLKN